MARSYQTYDMVSKDSARRNQRCDESLAYYEAANPMREGVEYVADRSIQFVTVDGKSVFASLGMMIIVARGDEVSWVGSPRQFSIEVPTAQVDSLIADETLMLNE